MKILKKVKLSLMLMEYHSTRTEEFGCKISVGLS